MLQELNTNLSNSDPMNAENICFELSPQNQRSRFNAIAKGFQVLIQNIIVRIISFIAQDHAKPQYLLIIVLIFLQQLHQQKILLVFHLSPLWPLGFLSPSKQNTQNDLNNPIGQMINNIKIIFLFLFSGSHLVFLQMFLAKLVLS